MPEAVIFDATRTPIGRAMKRDIEGRSADDLAAIPLRALVERNPGIEFGETNDIMMGGTLTEPCTTKRASARPARVGRRMTDRSHDLDFKLPQTAAKTKSRLAH